MQKMYLVLYFKQYIFKKKYIIVYLVHVCFFNKKLYLCDNYSTLINILITI